MRPQRSQQLVRQYEAEREQMERRIAEAEYYREQAERELQAATEQLQSLRASSSAQPDHRQMEQMRLQEEKIVNLLRELHELQEVRIPAL